MTALDHVPVLLLGRRSEVLVRNALLRAVLGHGMDSGTVFVRYLLTDPSARARITNWDDFAAASVGGLRLEAGRRPDDQRLAALVDELRADPDVARWWADHGVRDHTSLTKHIAHPVAGPLTFDIEAVSGPHDADQRLVVYTVQPDSPTARILPLLAGWVEDEQDALR